MVDYHPVRDRPICFFPDEPVLVYGSTVFELYRFVRIQRLPPIKELERAVGHRTHLLWVEARYNSLYTMLAHNGAGYVSFSRSLHYTCVIAHGTTRTSISRTLFGTAPEIRTLTELGLSQLPLPKIGLGRHILHMSKDHVPLGTKLWHRYEESNLGLRFWRPPRCHYTIPMWRRRSDSN
jgi:hypothetical protein